ncbi:hypothetical protein ACPUVO_10060 [Pseudocolwellia sp. HL-MZ19]|uniref:hypothetical protein n=1 Tax=Pseudocolwellia sp. HL-MZ19 TaxID=3400846 RepID=UPI003CF6E452
MIKLLKGIWRGFLGGVDYKNDATYQFTLDSEMLEVVLPCDYPISFSDRDLHYPYQSIEWFEDSARVEEQHKFIAIITDGWNFRSFWSLLFYRVYGTLRCSIRLKKTDCINVLDKQALSQYVVQAYDDFYNGPEGSNTQLRQLIQEQLPDVSPEHLEVETMARIHVWGHPSIPAAMMKSINNIEWVFYQEIRDTSFERKDFYCLPLNEDTFLEVRFNYIIQKRPKKFKRWEKYALELQERIMKSIRLTDIVAVQASKNTNSQDLK